MHIVSPQWMLTPIIHSSLLNDRVTSCFLRTASCVKCTDFPSVSSACMVFPLLSSPCWVTPVYMSELSSSKMEDSRGREKTKKTGVIKKVNKSEYGIYMYGNTGKISPPRGPHRMPFMALQHRWASFLSIVLAQHNLPKSFFLFC